MKKKLLAITMALMMLVPMALAAMIPASAAVSGTNAVAKYGDGKVIFDENYFKTNLATALCIQGTQKAHSR